MLDEPLGSLDADLRERLVLDLREIIKAAGVTAIYVTHDQQEAFAIADRIAVMQTGRIEQIDAPDQLYLRPKSRSVATFLGLRNIIPAEDFPAFGVESTAEYVLLHPAFLEWPSDDPRFKLEVVRRVFRGHYVQLTLRHTNGSRLSMQIPSTVDDLPAEGDMLDIGIRDGGIVPLRD